MTQSLFLTWQDKGREEPTKPPTRAWYPVGRLDDEGDGFCFRYIQGALRANQEVGFQPLDAFPEFHKNYKSKELFPLFKNRLPSSKRDDFGSFMEYLGLPSTNPNPFEILAITGGGRKTDNMEVFPKLQKSKEGCFSCRFFLHGWRHVCASAQDRINSLKESEQLIIALELNNPVTGLAIQLQTMDGYHMIGWTPRYLVDDMIKAVGSLKGNIVASVVKTNPSPAPYNQRVLIQLTGVFPDDYHPMELGDFQSI